ncbi:hypothetical protein C2S51_025719 [Perilla frutescens var. frutescens]|nr:hypothetical protein C2S51_025719 [Perilla frutescens var. frutescens]
MNDQEVGPLRARRAVSGDADDELPLRKCQVVVGSLERTIEVVHEVHYQRAEEEGAAAADRLVLAVEEESEEDPSEDLQSEEREDPLEDPHDGQSASSSSD